MKQSSELVRRIAYMQPIGYRNTGNVTNGIANEYRGHHKNLWISQVGIKFQNKR